MSNDARKKILLVGAYGAGNKGDDAILHSIVTFFPEYTFTATEGKKGHVTDIFPVRTVSCWMNEGFTPRVICSVAWGTLKMVAALGKADALFFGGGSLIHDLTKYNLPFMFFWHGLAKMLGKKVYYVSIGIGPIQTKAGRTLCKWFLPSANLLFVRDQRGKDICDRLNISNAQQTYDVVFRNAGAIVNHPELLRRFGLTANNFIAVTGCRWFDTQNFWSGKTNFHAEIQNFADCLRYLIQTTGLKLAFVTTDTRDYTLGQQLASLFSEDEFLLLPSTLGCLEVQSLIAAARFLFGVRMHSLIFAANAGVPFIAAVYDDKVPPMLRALDMEPYAIPISELSVSRVEALFPDFMNHQAEIRDLLIQKTSMFKENINQHLCQIQEDLDGAAI